MTGAALCLLQRDLRLAWLRPGDALGTLFFFVAAAVLYPLAAGPEPAQLAAVAPAVLWSTALLSVMLSLPRLFAADLADGSLEQLMLAPAPLPLLVLAKALAHWLVAAAPLLALAPLLGLMFGLPAAVLPALGAGLLLGTPTLCLLGAVGAALTLGLRSAGVLTTLLVLPLGVPVLVFGASAVDAALHGQSVAPHLQLLAGLLLLAAVLAPWAAAAALRGALG